MTEGGDSFPTTNVTYDALASFLFPNHFVVENVGVGDDDADDGNQFVDEPVALAANQYTNTYPNKLDDDIAE
jgi:hypothetical protein